MKELLRFSWLILLLLFVASCSTMGPQTTQNTETIDRTPQPYEDDEFPQWSKDLRRGEIILLGSLPLVYMLTNLAYDNIHRALYEEEGQSLIFNDSEHSLNKITISVSISGVITLTDYFLSLADRKRDARNSSEDQP